MKIIKCINVVAVGLLLSVGVCAHANDKSVFVRGSMEVTPSWFVTSNEITDPVSELNFKAEMLSADKILWTIGNLPSLQNDCNPVHLLAYRGVGVNHVDITVPSNSRYGSCTAYFDLDNTKVSIVDPGRTSMWSTYIDDSAESELDIRQIEINDLATMSILSETGANNSIVDATVYVDAAKVQLTNTVSNTVAMRLDVVSRGNNYVRYSKQFSKRPGDSAVTLLCLFVIV